MAAALLGLSSGQGLGWRTGLSVAVFVAGTSLRVALDATAGDEAPPAARARILSVYTRPSPSSGDSHLGARRCPPADREDTDMVLPVDGGSPRAAR